MGNNYSNTNEFRRSLYADKPPGSASRFRPDMKPGQVPAHLNPGAAVMLEAMQKNRHQTHAFTRVGDGKTGLNARRAQHTVSPSGLQQPMVGHAVAHDGYAALMLPPSPQPNHQQEAQLQAMNMRLAQQAQAQAQAQAQLLFEQQQRAAAQAAAQQAQRDLVLAQQRELAQQGVTAPPETPAPSRGHAGGRMRDPRSIYPVGKAEVNRRPATAQQETTTSAPGAPLGDRAMMRQVMAINEDAESLLFELDRRLKEGEQLTHDLGAHGTLLNKILEHIQAGVAERTEIFKALGAINHRVTSLVANLYTKGQLAAEIEALGGSVEGARTRDDHVRIYLTLTTGAHPVEADGAVDNDVLVPLVPEMSDEVAAAHDELAQEIADNHVEEDVP